LNDLNTIKNIEESLPLFKGIEEKIIFLKNEYTKFIKMEAPTEIKKEETKEDSVYFSKFSKIYPKKKPAKNLNT
jgi:hypothetical protein